jgi:hypothetical protein
VGGGNRSSIGFGGIALCNQYAAPTKEVQDTGIHTTLPITAPCMVQVADARRGAGFEHLPATGYRFVEVREAP